MNDEDKFDFSSKFNLKLLKKYEAKTKSTNLAKTENSDEVVHSYEEISKWNGIVEVLGKSQNINMRDKYASRVYWFLVSYAVFVGLLIIANSAINYFYHREIIGENVVMVLVGSTAASAIGLVNSVIKGLFPNNAKK